MADDSLRAFSNTLIGGRFAVDTSQALPDAGGGIPAYLARDRQLSDSRRVALLVARDASPRARALKVLTEQVDNLMVPLAHGMAALPGGKGEGYFIICTPPPGPPVSAKLNVWPEKALIDLVLRPVAYVLELLRERRLTHRAIRPNNVFQAAPGQAVTLGAAWAAPAAMHQPAVFESPYTAMCQPAARGEGSIADDVYALGVLLITLAGGKVPLAQFDDPTAIRWKLDLGSFAALTRDVSISGSFGDLLRGMLAEDPDHRPLPSLLLDPASARNRRVAARPARRTQQPLMLGEITVFDAGNLAFALFSDERKAVQFLRSGLVTQWLRRGLGDAALASQIEDLVRNRASDTKSGSRADALLIMHTISVINPRMPLCWRGVAIWPDCLPALLAEAMTSPNNLEAIVEELLTHDIPGQWAAGESRKGRADPFPPSPDLPQQRQTLQSGGPGGLLRLFYEMNPLLPCKVPAMASIWVSNINSLMEHLENASEKAGDTLIDPQIAAFIAARADRKTEMQVSAFITTKDIGKSRLDELMLLQDLQVRYNNVAMPGLAKWVAKRLRPDLDRWRNRPKRAALQARLDALAQAGFVSRLLALVTDRAARAQDLAGAQSAARELASIDAAFAAIAGGDDVRLANAERFGQAITAGIGLSLFILMVLLVLQQ